MLPKFTYLFRNAPPMGLETPAIQIDHSHAPYFPREPNHSELLQIFFGLLICYSRLVALSGQVQPLYIVGGSCA